MNIPNTHTHTLKRHICVNTPPRKQHLGEMSGMQMTCKNEKLWYLKHWDKRFENEALLESGLLICQWSGLEIEEAFPLSVSFSHQSYLSRLRFLFLHSKSCKSKYTWQVQGTVHSVIIPSPLLSFLWNIQVNFFLCISFHSFLHVFIPFLHKHFHVLIQLHPLHFCTPTAREQSWDPAGWAQMPTRNTSNWTPI